MNEEYIYMYRNSEASKDVEGSDTLWFLGLLLRYIGFRYSNWELLLVMSRSSIGFDFCHFHSVCVWVCVFLFF